MSWVEASRALTFLESRTSGELAVANIGLVAIQSCTCRRHTRTLLLVLRHVCPIACGCRLPIVVGVPLRARFCVSCVCTTHQPPDLVLWLTFRPAHLHTTLHHQPTTAAEGAAGTPLLELHHGVVAIQENAAGVQLQGH